MPIPSRAERFPNNHRNFRPHRNPQTEQDRVYKQLQRKTTLRCSYWSIKPGRDCDKWECPACRLRRAREWISSTTALLEAALARSEPVYRLVAGHEDAQHLEEARKRYNRFKRLLDDRHPGCRVAWALGVNDDGYLHRHVLVAGPVSRLQLVDLLVEVGLLDERRRGARKWAVQEVADAAALIHHIRYAAANGSAYVFVHAPHVKNLRPYSYRPRS